MRFATTVLVVLLLVGCQSTHRPVVADVRLTTDRAAYAPGGEVRLQLVNATDQGVGYNLCTAALEQETPDGWRPAGEAAVCTMIQNGLEPGDTASYTKTLDAGLPAGRYRYVADVEHRASGRREPVATDTFSVEG